MERRVFVFSFLLLVSVHADTKYRLCVPEVAANACLQLVASEGLDVTCVVGRDKVECLQKIHRHEADFMQVDPEDMYVAARMTGQNFKIFSEVRSKENLNNNHRYEAVAVVHNNLPINNVLDLKGTNSCHTGIGRNVGYKIPVAKLSQNHVLEPLTDSDLTPRENELRALSRAFDKACIVGKWAPDVETDRRLKSTYPDLCSLCEFPAKCDYPDKYSGYEGALKCLAEKGGDVAWTKYAVAKDFFGLSEGKTAQADPSHFSFACPQGNKRPVTGEPCAWAARPWPAFLTNNDVSKIGGMRQQISKTGNADDKILQATLGLSAKLTAVAREPVAPQDFLAFSQYNDVIERVAGAPDSLIRLCVPAAQMTRCGEMSEVAFSRDVRPRISCVQSADCVSDIKNNKADATVLDSYAAYLASRSSDMHSIMYDDTLVGSGSRDAQYYQVAVVLANSSFNSPQDLKDHSACMGYVSSSGSNGIEELLANSLLTMSLAQVEGPLCSAGDLLAKFFSAGVCACQPQDLNPLPSVCPASASCSATSSSDMQRRTLQCLHKGRDIAFVSAASVLSNTEGSNRVMNAEDLKLMCCDGGTAPISDFAKCYAAQIPRNSIAVSNHKAEARVEEMRMAFLDLSNLMVKRPELFSMSEGTDGSLSSLESMKILDMDQSVQSRFDSQIDRFYSLCPKSH